MVADGTFIRQHVGNVTMPKRESVGDAIPNARHILVNLQHNELHRMRRAVKG